MERRTPCNKSFMSKQIRDDLNDIFGTCDKCKESIVTYDLCALAPTPQDFSEMIYPYGVSVTEKPKFTKSYRELKKHEQSEIGTSKTINALDNICDLCGLRYKIIKPVTKTSVSQTIKVFEEFIKNELRLVVEMDNLIKETELWLKSKNKKV